jgi:hypothetical protein
MILLLPSLVSYEVILKVAAEVDEGFVHPVIVK